MPLDLPNLETDARFPSGAWTGFFLQPWITRLAGRQMMTLDMTFHDGLLEATGNDIVGQFTFSGTYDLQDGNCRWTKQYRRRHQVSYSGVNDGQGIWGVWEIRQLWGLYVDRGVFHLWPQGMEPRNASEITERAQELLGDNKRGPWAKGVLGVIVLVLGIGLYVGVKIGLRLLFRWLGG
jgi:hypothetical protein